MLRGFVAKPELGAVDRESRHDTAAGVHPMDLRGAKCRFVELERAHAAANGEPRRERRLNQ
jgi:hypothetical protein